MASSGMAAQLTVVCSFSLMRCPSSSTSVFWSPKMPKPRMSTCWLGDPDRSRVRMPESVRRSSGTVVAVLRLMSSCGDDLDPDRESLARFAEARRGDDDRGTVSDRPIGCKHCARRGRQHGGDTRRRLHVCSQQPVGLRRPDTLLMRMPAACNGIKEETRRSEIGQEKRRTSRNPATSPQHGPGRYTGLRELGPPPSQEERKPPRTNSSGNRSLSGSEPLCHRLPWRTHARSPLRGQHRPRSRG